MRSGTFLVELETLEGPAQRKIKGQLCSNRIGGGHEHD
jgi:hypothetical protein